MTQKKKMIAAFLTVIFVLSALSAAFYASAAEQFCTISIEVYGDGSVSDGTSRAYSRLVAQYPIGETVEFSSTPGADKETVFWVNAATDRVVSFTDHYSLTISFDMYFYIVFEDTQAIAAQNGMHQVVYLSEGNNVMYSETLPIGDTEYYDESITSLNMYANGKVWTGWNKLPAEVAADSGRVFVRPTYSDAEEDKQFYVVTTIVGNSSGWKKCEFEEAFVATAPETLNGEPFSYWEVPRDENDPNSRDVIASYNRNYYFTVVAPITIRAVYGKEVTDGVVTRMVCDVPVMEESTLVLYTEWDVTSDYSVVAGGLLATRNASIGNSESAFVLNTGDRRIAVGTSEKHDRNVSYSVTITSWREVKDGTTDEYYYPLVYVRGYVIVRDSEGVQTTRYSPIHTVDYVNEAFIGVIEDNPHSDPLDTP